MQYVIAIVLFIVGVVAIIFNKWFLQNFGRVAWAEQKLGPEGGTRLFYILVGIALIFLAFFFASGRIFKILTWIFG